MTQAIEAETEQRSIGQLHAFSRLLYDRLVQVEIGEMITYRDLSAVIGQDVQADSRHHLNRARKMALRMDHRVFDVVVDVGLKRVVGVETVQVVEGQVGRIRRASKRGLDILATVDLTALAPSEVTRAHVVRAQVGLARVFAGEKTRRALTAKAEGATTLPSAQSVATQTLKLFGRE